MKTDKSNIETGGEAINPNKDILIASPSAKGKIATVNQHTIKLREYRDRSDDTAKS